MIFPPRLNLFSLVLPRFPFQVKFLHGQSVQRIALAWELVGEGEQIDVVFQLGLLSIPTKGRLIVVLARRSPRKFSVTQGSLLPQDLICNQSCYSEVKPRVLRKLCV